MDEFLDEFKKLYEEAERQAKKYAAVWIDCGNIGMYHTRRRLHIIEYLIEKWPWWVKLEYDSLRSILTLEFSDGTRRDVSALDVLKVRRAALAIEEVPCLPTSLSDAPRRFYYTYYFLTHEDYERLKKELLA